MIWDRINRQSRKLKDHINRRSGHVSFHLLENILGITKAHRESTEKDRELLSQVGEAMVEELTEREITVIRKRVDDGKSFQKIAWEVPNLSASNARIIYKRAIEKIKVYLMEKSGSDRPS